jgi:hypothetical protein
MKKIKISDSENKLINEDILHFENRYNIKLPKNYKDFLLKFNGGYVDDEERDFLHSFNSLKYGEVTLEDAIDTYILNDNLLSKDFLPIANTYSDNPITICLKQNQNFGKIVIFYFDRDEEPDFAANSLEELLGVKSIDEL